MSYARPFVTILALTLVSQAAFGQWTNRYPKIQGLSHHVYLEGYELPTLTNGPIDPAPSPDGRSVLFSSRGWIWALDLTTGTARRITDGGAMDSRPRWAPNGQSIAFVRDDTRDTWIVVRDLSTGQEREINTPAIDLDPAFSPDGRALYFSSAVDGALDLWQLDLATEERRLIARRPGQELAPSPHPDGRRLLYLHKGTANSIRLLDIETGEDRILTSERIISMTRPSLSPDGAVVAYNWPTQERYELRLLHVDDPATTVFLTASAGLPLTPTWSSDGQHVYFAEANDDDVFELKRIGRGGGVVETVPVQRWDWGTDIGRLRIVTRIAGEEAPAAARLAITDDRGHPVVAERDMSRFDGQNGRVFFYSPGVTEVIVPAGVVSVSAVRGLSTAEVVETVAVGAGATVEVEIDLTPMWNARASGWASGDHHFHLNYGGQYSLTPDDLLPMLDAEALDVATPLLANLHNRFGDQRFWDSEYTGDLGIVRFGQEIRSHFLGHLGFIGVAELTWPWVWGPGYQVYGQDDRPNSEAIANAHRQGGLATYVHPIGVPDPFTPEGMASVPIELVVDGVLGHMDLLEVACLWTDEIGSAEMWYRLLNIGVPVALTAGTDVMNNFYRTMAVGTTRVYVRTDGELNWRDYLAALEAGRSFVTNGPFLQLTLEGRHPGDVVDGSRSSSWEIDLRTTSGVERVELLVNGAVVWSSAGPEAEGTHTYDGTIDLPAGGWIAARAYGGETTWPAMDSYPFAHSGAVWIDRVGSTDPAAKRSAARELLQVLDIAERRLAQGYGSTPTPRISAEFAKARQILREAMP